MATVATGYSFGATELVTSLKLNQAVNSATVTTIANADVSATAAINITKIAVTSQAAGDILYCNGTNWVRLEKGTDGQVLTLASGVPSWATP